MSIENKISKLSWYMKYQPMTVSDYIFENETIKNLILKWLEQNFIDGNILFYGPPGTGKTALSEILIKKLITHEYDIKVIKSRSVNQIDELYSWCQSLPIYSVKKIVYIEEFDKLSKTAHTTLKDSILEKFQEHVSFICNTNFINKIDPAILSRFNHKIELIGNKEGIYNRLEQILISEDISFDKENLKDFINLNYKKGLRNLITSIQIGSLSGILNLDKKITNTLEDDITDLTLKIYQKIFSTQNIDKRKHILIDPVNSIISEEYYSLLNIINYNYDVSYEKIFIDLSTKIHFLPIKYIISKYLDNIESRKLPDITYIAFLYESMRSIMEISQ